MRVPQAVVCLPTYNERENLEPMLRALGDKGVRVLVVDDNSPDGTGEIADRLARELDYVDVLHRERKEGLGPAYLAGFRRVQTEGNGAVRFDLRRHDRRRSAFGLRALRGRGRGHCRENHKRDEHESSHGKCSSGCGRLGPRL